MFWLCHIVAIFWGLKFPFHARIFRTTHRIKYLHIACVALCTVLPLIPVVGTMVQYSRGKSFGEAVEGGLGFGVVRFPPLLCTGRNQDAMFYALILPVVVLLMAGMTVLIITFWIIHKVNQNLAIILKQWYARSYVTIIIIIISGFTPFAQSQWYAMVCLISFNVNIAIF